MRAVQLDIGDNVWQSISSIKSRGILVVSNKKSSLDYFIFLIRHFFKKSFSILSDRKGINTTASSKLFTSKDEPAHLAIEDHLQRN